MDVMLRAKDTGRVNVERILARSFVLLGGLFWTLAFFSANTKASYTNFVYTLPEIEKAATAALLPLAITVAVFVLGMFYERLAGFICSRSSAPWSSRALLAPRRGGSVGDRRQRSGGSIRDRRDPVSLRGAHAGVPGALGNRCDSVTCRRCAYDPRRLSAAARSAITSASSV